MPITMNDLTDAAHLRTLDESEVAQLLHDAIEHHQAWRYDEAETLYRAIIEHAPEMADAHHNLGVLFAIQRSQPQLALPHFEAALNINSASGQFWFSYLDALIRCGQQALAAQLLPVAEAQGLQRSVVNALGERVRGAVVPVPKPAPIPASVTASATATETGRTDAGALNASRFPGGFSVGGRPRAPAPTAAPMSVALAPGRALGQLSEQDKQAVVASFNRSDFARGEREVRALIERYPEEGFLWKALGTMLQPQGRKEEALAAKIRATELLPHDAEAACNLGRAYFELGRPAEAAVVLQAAIAAQPDHAEAHNNLGLALNAEGRVVESATCFERAVQLKPDFAEALNNLSGIYTAQGLIDDALGALRRAVAARADYRIAFDNLLFVLNYHPDLSDREIYRGYEDYERIFGTPHALHWKPHRNNRVTERRLKVGYVSPDFKNHACSFFLEPMLARHDRAAVEVFAYAEMHAEDDNTTLRLRGLVDHWVPTRGVDDDALAQRVRADGIDILVDLAGHTKGNRLGVFARKPAPVSISWMGFGYTTGLKAIDFYLTDETSVPAGSEHLFSERPWRLQSTAFAVYRPGADMGPVGTLPALGRGHVTLGTLTRGVRVNHHTIRVWAEILRRLPEAQLVIDSRSFQDPQLQAAMESRFAESGIDAGRLQIGCHSPPWDVLRGIDIGLDCFPHNSGTTLYETLYMGVPFVTLAGRASVGRIGSAILNGVGHPEWIAETEREYVEKVVALAGDLPLLARTRASLRQRMQASALMDEAGFARKVEAAYADMFRQWAASQPGAQSGGPLNAGDVAGKAFDDMTIEALQAELLYEQANQLHARGLAAEAERHFNRALAFAPRHVLAHNNLGLLQQEQGRYPEAEAHYRAALEADDKYALAHHNLGNVLQHGGDLLAAVACYRRALALGLDSQHLFDNLLFLLNYHPDEAAEQIYETYREYDRRFGLPHHGEWKPHANTRMRKGQAGRRLKVGYVSPDFRNHACGRFLEPLLASHDKSAVEIFAYAELSREDGATARYRGYVDHWVATQGLSDAQVAERVRADGIDVLVDVAGHTQGNRLGVFARKPAPVSVSWLGYGYTTGLSAIDYYLTDAASAPPGSEALFSESPWRLADAPFAVYRPSSGMGEVSPLPALARGHVTLCTLSRSIRLNDHTLRVWAEILRRLPTARLVIDSRNFETAESVRQLLVRFAAHGVDADRLQIGCHSPPWDVLRGADIGLDCFPHNSGTTLCETLYMGLPFVTLAGRPSVGRIGSAVLQGLRRTEWVAQTEAEYMEKVVALAQDLPALARTRAALRQQMQASALMDEAGFARKVEAAYAEMFSRWSSASVSTPAKAEHAQKMPKETARFTRQAVAAVPPQHELDAVLQLFRQHMFPEGEALARDLTRRFPDFGFAWKALGVMLQPQGKKEEALQAKERAAQLLPDDAEVHCNLGQVLQDLGRFAEAEVVLTRALALKEDYAEAHNNLAITYQKQGRLDESITHFKRALALKPAHEDIYGNLLFTTNYHADLTGEQIYESYREYDRRYGLPYRGEWKPHSNARDAGRKLKVGYVSPDFRNHACSRFLEPLLAMHDKGQVEVYAYAELAREDEATARYKGYVDHWVPTRGASDAQVAERVRADGIDVLVDLAGHTVGNRLGVFARKPAPVSVSWLGYGYTTGLSAIDYYLTDEASAPAGSESLFSEMPWRLPRGWVYRPAEGMGETGPLPALRNGCITFGTLTRSVRINHRTIRVWSEILRRVPGARLVVDSGSFVDAAAQQALAARFVEHGIAPDRLQIGYHSPPWDVLRGIDIGLDCFPHNSGTTLFESLYMGVPFVTLAGRPGTGLLGSAILEGVGHPEWIASTEEAYVDKVAALAQDVASLADLRQNLRRDMQMSSLMNERGFAADVEAAYRSMFDAWCAVDRHPLTVRIEQAEAAFDRATSQQEAGKHVEAEAGFRRALVLIPEFADANARLGTLLQEQGRHTEAEPFLREALALRPNQATAHHNLGTSLRLQGRMAEAEASFRAALALQPDLEPSQINLNQLLQESGRWLESEVYWREVVRQKPEAMLGYLHLSNVLMRQQRIAEAETCLRKALDANSDNISVHQHLCALLKETNQYPAAEVIARQALELEPDSASLWNQLGEVLNASQRLVGAEQAFRKALELDPQFVSAHGNLGIVLQNMGCLHEAEASMRRSLALRPDNPNAHGNLLFVMNYHPDKSGQEIFAEYRAFDRQFGLPHRSEWRPHGNAPAAGRRLKVGYVSPDFRNHSCTYFVEPLLECHDKNAVEVYAYADLSREDAATMRYKRSVDHWVPTRGMSDAALAERVRADGIDILVDLAGHTAGNRLGMFARKPAPVSLSWLGYGCTTGLSAIDYYLTDAVHAPAGSESVFSETPWRLPTGWIYRPPVTGQMGDVGDAPALRNGYVTFGTLTRAVRINHRTIRVWSALLHRVAGARLVIDSRSYQDAETQAQLASRFAEHGIAGDRLLIGYHTPPWDTVRGIDIGLDCFPHNSGTTLFESLYMGVPYVTLADRPSVGCLGGSILQGIGHPEWIAATEADYVEKAAALAADHAALAELRAGLRQQMQASPLMDEPGFARQVEGAFRAMFEQWENRRP